MASSNDPHNKTLILHYGGSSYGGDSSDIPIAIEFITNDDTGIYSNNYVMLAKEEQFDDLTAYVINPGGQIIMDIGIDPSSPNNAITNSIENIFGFDLNNDEIQGSLPEGISWIDEIHFAKMLGFKTFTYTPGNTDLFIDYSSNYGDIYFADSEITYDNMVILFMKIIMELMDIKHY